MPSTCIIIYYSVSLKICWDWKLLSWFIHISLSIVISSLFLKVCDFFLRVLLERYTSSHTHTHTHTHSVCQTPKCVWIACTSCYILLTYKLWCSRSVTDPFCFVFLTMSMMLMLLVDVDATGLIWRLSMLSSKIQDAFRTE